MHFNILYWLICAPCVVQHLVVYIIGYQLGRNTFHLVDHRRGYQVGLATSDKLTVGEVFLSENHGHVCPFCKKAIIPSSGRSKVKQLFFHLLLVCMKDFKSPQQDSFRLY